MTCQHFVLMLSASHYAAWRFEHLGNQPLANKHTPRAASSLMARPPFPCLVHIQGVCDRDQVAINVRDLMRTWLTCERFPVLRVRMAEGRATATTLNITQQPFSFYGVASDSGTGATSSSTTHETNVASACASEAEAAGQPAAARGGGESGVDRTCVRPAAAAQQAPAVSGSGESGGNLRWVIPLRIRVGDGSTAGAKAAAAPAVAGAGAARTECSFVRESTRGTRGAEEVVHSVMMTQESMAVVLRGLPASNCASGSSSTSPLVASGAAHPDPGVKQAGNTDAKGGGGAMPIRAKSSSGDKMRDGGRPYLVINDEHSGFFTVQYECERSWALALAALEDGVLSDCEAMGFVHDLILGLHEGVLVDRGVLGIVAVTNGISMTGSDSGGGDNQKQEGHDHGSVKNYCDVPRLFARLRQVVRILGRDRSHPAWCPGKLFIWELLLVCASNALANVEELRTRLLGESLAAAKRHLDAVLTRGKEAGGDAAAACPCTPAATPSPVVFLSGDLPAAGGRRAEATAGDDKEEGEVTQAAGSSSTARGVETVSRGASTCSPMEVDAERSTTDGGASCSPVTAEERRGGKKQTTSDEASSSHDGGWGPCSTATLDADSRRTRAEAAVARSRLLSILKDVRQATEEIEEHMRWHDDRVDRGEKQAAEPGESLAAMRDRMIRMMKRCVAQLSQQTLGAAPARNSAPPTSTNGDVRGVDGETVVGAEESAPPSPLR